MRQFKDLTFFDPKFRVSIELHQRLLKLEPKQYFADFIQSVDFARYPAISNSHYCLYLILHGAIALWPRLKWVADMSLLFRAMQSEQFQQILELAEKYGCRAAVIASLKLAEKTFPGSLSEALLSSLDEASKDERTALILKLFEETLSSSSGKSSNQPGKQPLFFDAYRLIFGKQFSLAKIFQYRIANSIALRT